jgi:hypothetical protein
MLWNWIPSHFIRQLRTFMISPSRVILPSEGARKPKSSARHLLLSFAAAVAWLWFPSCAAHVDSHRYDNPRIRARQESQLKALVPSSSEQQRLAHHIGSRVVMVTAIDPSTHPVVYPPLGGGRAAAISSDGYFLTAEHVVGNRLFFLEEPRNPAKSPGKRSGRSVTRVRHLQGRLVWRDAALDLAIIKFDRNTSSYFESFASPGKGDLLHAADESGRYLLSAASLDWNARVGNGPFHAVGKVIATTQLPGPAGGTSILTNMVARGGMSGAAAVTQHGNLAGIVVEVRLFPWFLTGTRTVVRMIPPDRLRELIDKDRHHSQSRT